MEIDGRKYSNQEIADIIELEGLDYTVQHGITIENIEVREYFKKAKEYLDKIDIALKEYGW